MYCKESLLTKKMDELKMGPRERECFLAMFRFEHIQEIADHMFISDKGVKCHVGNILRKTKFKRRTGLLISYNPLYLDHIQKNPQHMPMVENRIDHINHIEKIDKENADNFLVAGKQN